MKKILLSSAIVAMGAILLYAAGPNHVNRFGYQSILSTGGSTTTNAKTVMVTEDGTTNEYSMALITATVSGAATASTNTFGTAYIATPTVVAGRISTASGTIQTNSVFTPITITTTGVIVNGLSTNAVTGPNSIPLLIYGYKRTGVFE